MAPKTSEQFEAIRKKSQQNIEQAAMELFARRGYHNSSISQIAKKAGISKGLLYNYYDSKEDLLHQIVSNVMQDSAEPMEAFLQSDLPALEKITLITEYSIQMVQTDAHLWRLLTSLAMQEDVMDQVKAIVDKNRMEMMQVGITLFEEMGFADPEKEAMLYGAIMDGMMIQYMTLGKDFPLEDLKNYLIAKYKNHVTTKK